MPFSQRQTTRQCAHLVTLVWVFLLQWPWPWPWLDKIDIGTWPKSSEGIYLHKIKFLGYGFQKLEHKQDRQTDTHRHDPIHYQPHSLAAIMLVFHSVVSKCTNTTHWWCWFKKNSTCLWRQPVLQLDCETYCIYSKRISTFSRDLLSNSYRELSLVT